MSLVKKIFKMAGIMLLYMIVFDVAEVVVSFILDVLFSLPVRGAGVGAFYAIWFVLGIFCGLLSYGTAGGMAYPKSENDWTTKPDALANGRIVLATSVVVLVGLVPLCLRFSGSIGDDYFVPDNVPLTITFFVAIAIGTFVGHKALPSAPKKPRP